MKWKIAHIADVHIQERRREEYANVFEELYKKLREEFADIGEANIDTVNLIVIAGDVFDTCRVTPHMIEDVCNFIVNLSEIAPIVMIPGNHDLNTKIAGDLDALTPVLRDHIKLQPPQLTYCRDSGIYYSHGIKWTVIANDGEIPQDISGDSGSSNEDKMPNVCIFHEEINGGYMPSGMEIKGYRVGKNYLKNFDLAMGGHIHLQQKLGDRAAYCGSLVQQNIGEPHNGHGCVIWELESSSDGTFIPSFKPIDIENKWGGFLRIMLDENGEVMTKNILKNPTYWEVFYDNEICSEVLESKIYELTELFSHSSDHKHGPRVVRPLVSESAAKSNQLDYAQSQDFNYSIEKQCELIEEIMAKEPREIIDDLIKLHTSKLGKYNKIEVGSKFRILRLEFSNMYAFGEGNYIDFTQLEKCVSGIVAPNHTGKSSLVDALLFMLYEIHPRTSSKRDVVHVGGKVGHGYLDFELNGRTGRIEKRFLSKSNQSESFYRFHYAGENLTEKSTTDTLKAINKVLGSHDIALASCFQIQGGESTGFTFETPLQRKKTLKTILSLGDFDEIENYVKSEIKTYKGQLSTLEKQFRGKTADELEYEIEQFENDKDIYTARIEELSDIIANLREQLEKISFKLGKADYKLKMEEEILNERESCYSSGDIAKKIAAECESLGKAHRADGVTSNELTEEDLNTIILYKKLLDESKDSNAVLEKISEHSANLHDIDNKLSALLYPLPEYMDIPEQYCEYIPETLPGSLKIAVDTICNIFKQLGDKLNANSLATSLELLQRMTEDYRQKELTALERLEKKKSEYAICESRKELQEIHKPRKGCSNCERLTKYLRETRTVDLNKYQDKYDKAAERLGKMESILDMFTKALDHISRAKYSIRCLLALKENTKTRLEELTNLPCIAARKELDKIADRAREICFIVDSFDGEYVTPEIIESSRKKVEILRDKFDKIQAKNNEFRKRLSEAETEKSSVDSQIMMCEKCLSSHEIILNEEKLRAEQVEEVKYDLELRNKYLILLRPKSGIPDRLLESGKNMLETRINEALQELGARFYIKFDDYVINMINDGIKLSANLGSGYQKFVLSLAARLSLWRISQKNRPDAFFIDEGFGVCDEDHLEAMADALEALSSAPDGPKLLFIVSHVDALKERLAKSITIRRIGSTSYLNSSCATSVVDITDKPVFDIGPSSPRLCEREPVLPQERESASSSSSADEIVIQTEEFGKLYCRCCKQVITVSRKNLHIRSKKHANNLEKM